MAPTTLPKEVHGASFGFPSSEADGSNGYGPGSESPIISSTVKETNRPHKSSRAAFLRLVATIVAVNALILLTLQCFRNIRFFSKSPTGIYARLLAVDVRGPCRVTADVEEQKVGVVKLTGTASVEVDQQRRFLTVTHADSEHLTDADKEMIQEASTVLTSASESQQRARRRRDARRQVTNGYQTVIDGLQLLQDASATAKAKRDLEAAEEEERRAEAELLLADGKLLGLRPSPLQHSRALQLFLTSEGDRRLPLPVAQALAAAEAITLGGALQVDVTLEELTSRSVQYAEDLKGSASGFVQWFGGNMASSTGSDVFSKKVKDATDLVDLGRRFCATFQSALKHPAGEETVREVEALSEVLASVYREHRTDRGHQAAHERVDVTSTSLTSVEIGEETTGGVDTPSASLGAFIEEHSGDRSHKAAEKHVDVTSTSMTSVKIQEETTQQVGMLAASVGTVTEKRCTHQSHQAAEEHADVVSNSLTAMKIQEEMSREVDTLVELLQSLTKEPSTDRSHQAGEEHVDVTSTSSTTMKTQVETAREAETLAELLGIFSKEPSADRNHQTAGKHVEVTSAASTTAKIWVTTEEGQSFGVLETRLIGHSERLIKLLESTTTCGDAWRDLEQEFSSALICTRLVPADLSVNESPGLHSAHRLCKERLSEVLGRLEARWTRRTQRFHSQFAGSLEKINSCFANIHFTDMVYEDPLAKEVLKLAETISEGRAFSDLLASLQFLESDASPGFRDLVVDFRKELSEVAEQPKDMDERCRERWLSRLDRAADLYTASSKEEGHRTLLRSAITRTEEDVRVLENAMRILGNSGSSHRSVLDKAEQLRCICRADEKRSKKRFGTLKGSLRGFMKRK